jgi:hypothetical protein
MANEFKIKNGLIVESGSSVISGSLTAPSITGSLFGTSSWAETASFTLTASYVDIGTVLSASYASSSTSASYALTASYAQNAGTTINTSSLATTASNTFIGNQTVTGWVSASAGFTGSLLGTASWAVTAAYAENNNLIESTLFTHTQSAANIIWDVNHNLNTQTPLVTIYDSTFKVIIPEEVESINANLTRVYFPISSSGYATVVGKTLYVTASPLSASYALTASYAQNAGSSINTGSFATTASNTFIGNQTVSGSIFATGSSFDFRVGAITASRVSASLGFTGSLLGTASWAVSASQAISASYVLQAVSASWAISSSRAISASWAPTDRTGSFTGSFTGSLLGTSSWAISASQAVTASYVLNAVSASFATSASQAISASWAPFVATPTGAFATTASNTFIGNQTITGSIFATGSTFNFVGGTITASRVSASNGFTGSLLGTASWAISASQAVTASYILQAVSASFATLAQTSNTASLALRASGSLTGSLLGTASWAVSASNAVSAAWAPGGGGGTPGGSNTQVQYNSASVFQGKNTFTFDYTTDTLTVSGGLAISGAGVNSLGTTQITGSLVVTQNVTFSGLSNNDALTRVIVQDTNGNMAWRTATSLGGGGGDGIWSTGSGGNIYYNDGNVGIGLVTASTPLQVVGMISASSMKADSFTGSLLGTASWAVSSSIAVTASYVLQAVSASFASTASLALRASGSLTGSLLGTASLALRASGSLTGSLLGTASWAVSASNAVSAAWAPGGSPIDTSAFATTASNTFIGNQTISGSIFASGANFAFLIGTVTASRVSASLGFTGSLLGTSSWALTSSRAVILNIARTINGTSFNGSANITPPVNVTNRTTNESGHLIFISTTATGNQIVYSNTNLRVNPSTAIITATGFTGSLFGTSSWAVSASHAVSASWAPGGTGATPGGSNTQVQYNSASVFQGKNTFLFDYNTNTLTVSGGLAVSGAGSNILGSTQITGSLDINGALMASNTTAGPHLIISGTVSSSTLADFFAQGQVKTRISGSGLFQTRGDVVAFFTFSDERLKTDILPICGSLALDQVNQLQGVYYKWKEGREGKTEVGFIAQQVEKVVPEVVRELPRLEGSGESVSYKSVDYEHMVALLTEAIKEQQLQINDLQNQINELKTKI